MAKCCVCGKKLGLLSGESFSIQHNNLLICDECSRSRSNIKIKIKKQDNSPIDTNILFKAVDAQDVIKEVEVKNSENLINAENSKKENKEVIYFKNYKKT